jgi:thymidylate synthase (FAD)
MGNNIIKVLDHGFVRLVDHMGNDLSVVRAARVSYDSAWRAGADQGSDERLIHYLWRNKHTTPFEAVEFQFEVKAPIFVFRQWHRHRTWTYNEVSARYRELPEEFYVPSIELIGTQSKSNKQAREFSGVASFRKVQVDAYIKCCVDAHSEYRGLLADGWPRELARAVLPLATYSYMFAKIDLHNLLHFLALRLHEHAQYEIRVYAEAMLKLIDPIVPVCVAAWEGH